MRKFSHILLTLFVSATALGPCYGSDGADCWKIDKKKTGHLYTWYGDAAPNSPRLIEMQFTNGLFSKDGSTVSSVFLHSDLDLDIASSLVARLIPLESGVEDYEAFGSIMQSLWAPPTPEMIAPEKLTEILPLWDPELKKFPLAKSAIKRTLSEMTPGEFIKALRATTPDNPKRGDRANIGLVLFFAKETSLDKQRISVSDFLTALRESLPAGSMPDDVLASMHHSLTHRLPQVGWNGGSSAAYHQVRFERTLQKMNKLGIRAGIIERAISMKAGYNPRLQAKLEEYQRQIEALEKEIAGCGGNRPARDT